jgi:hypothetical protein
MKLVKLTPKCQRAKNRVKEHGETMEILLDFPDKVMVRSLNDTWTYPDGSKGKWVGTLRKEEAEWEEM